MRKILTLLLPVLGIAGGVAAGIFLKPPPATPPPEAAAQEGSSAPGPTEAGADQPGEATDRSYVKIGRQTVIPVVEGGETRALMLFELAIDVPAGLNDRALTMEPRLRDAFLKELFQMSYSGAFLTTFTDDRIIEELRRNLVRAAREHLGNGVRDVLILDVMRQEL